MLALGRGSLSCEVEIEGCGRGDVGIGDLEVRDRAMRPLMNTCVDGQRSLRFCIWAGLERNEGDGWRVYRDVDEDVGKQIKLDAKVRDMYIRDSRAIFAVSCMSCQRRNPRSTSSSQAFVCSECTTFVSLTSRPQQTFFHTHQLSTQHRRVQTLLLSSQSHPRPPIPPSTDCYKTSSPCHAP